MMKITYAVAAALIAAAIITLPGLTQVQANAPILGAKGDRVDARALGTECSKNEWPYFETACLRDSKNAFGQAHQVRIVTTDRLPQPVASVLATSR
jgi:hypothetical protein